MIEKITMTCITCPIGCELTVEFENKKFISVSGNDCNRGKTYASTEIQNPRRTLTSTVVISNTANKATTKYLPIKTSSPIAKNKVLEFNSIEDLLPKA
jgi:CxxC motif-containing protein